MSSHTLRSAVAAAVAAASGPRASRRRSRVAASAGWSTTRGGIFSADARRRPREGEKPRHARAALVARRGARGRAGRDALRAVSEPGGAETKVAEKASARPARDPDPPATEASVAAEDASDAPTSASADSGNARGSGRRHSSDAAADDDAASLDGSAAAALPLVAFAGLIGIGAYYKEDINEYLTWFIGYVESLGPAGPASFMALYVLLEILAVPAIPLTMSAGAIFGPAQGTAMVSVSATLAATASFLIARYALRDRIGAVAEKYPKWRAIDDAIGEDSFRVVALLRLSPLLPFALSNYLYGLTSVKLRPYVLASWLGMLPGTFAYVSAGSVGRTMMEAGNAAATGGGAEGAQGAAGLAGGFALALISGSYVANLAAEALKDVEEEMNKIEEQTERRARE